MQQSDRAKPRILNILAPHFLLWPTAPFSNINYTVGLSIVISFHKLCFVVVVVVALFCFKIIKQK